IILKEQKMPILNRCATACALALSLLGSSVSAHAGEQEELTQKLDESVMTYAYSKSSSDMDTINELIKNGAHPTIQTVWYAAYYKQPALLDRFLDMSVNVNQAISDNGETVLLSALGNTDKSELSDDDLHILQSLLKAGANTNVIAQGGTNTPLIAAAQSQGAAPALVKLLLQFGADAKQVTPQGFSPIMGEGAANLEVIKLLVAAGTDPYGVSKVGSTPLHFVCTRDASQDGQPDPQAAQRIALLHKPGTSIDAQPPQQQAWPVGTPLLESLTSNNPDCVKALLAAGADKDALAFPAEYVAADPSVKGKTVRQNILGAAEKYPDLYSPEIVALFQK
ncbi:TPA: hypothetical protein NBJ75_004706, partial [Serratia marcescens]|nr:hypothetical protein [Serratia marcescens]